MWRATVGFSNVAVEPTVPAHGPGSLVGADRGVEVTLATSDAEMLRMPRYVAAMRALIVDLERARARTQQGSRAWRRLGGQTARARRKAAAQVDHWARETANTLVAQHAVLAVEQLNLQAMTRSARGTKEEPGTNVAQKQGLNREPQDAALGRLAVRICVKAESAGRSVWMVNPSNTSQRCSACGHTEPANRPSQARFACTACGHETNADVNAARNIAELGRQCEQAWATAGRVPITRRRSRRRPTRNTPEPAPTPRRSGRGRVGSAATPDGRTRK